MQNYHALVRRLARLEQQQGNERQPDMIASWQGDEFGRLLLASMSPEARQVALLGGPLSCDVSYPPLRAWIAADSAAWRAQRGLPLRGSAALFESW
jgi:hypothetical protein